MQNSWNNIVAGSYINGSIMSYTTIMGLWFYALVMFIGMSLIYFKNGKFENVVLTGILISGAAIPFMPSQVMTLIFVMAAFGIAIILYKLFHSGKY